MRNAHQQPPPDTSDMRPKDDGDSTLGGTDRKRLLYFHQVLVFHENRGYRAGMMFVAGRFDRIAPLWVAIRQAKSPIFRAS
jgi:hypothetical protein